VAIEIGWLRGKGPIAHSWVTKKRLPHYLDAGWHVICPAGYFAMYKILFNGGHILMGIDRDKLDDNGKV